MRQIFLLYHPFPTPSTIMSSCDCVCSRKHVKECLCKFTIDTGVKHSFWRTLFPPPPSISPFFLLASISPAPSRSPSNTLHNILLLSNALCPWPSHCHATTTAVIMCSCNLSDSLLHSVSPWILCSLTFKYIQIEIIPANARPSSCMWVVRIRYVSGSYSVLLVRNTTSHARCIKLGAAEESNCNLHEFLWGTI